MSGMLKYLNLGLVSAGLLGLVAAPGWAQDYGANVSPASAEAASEALELAEATTANSRMLDRESSSSATERSGPEVSQTEIAETALASPATDGLA